MAQNQKKSDDNFLKSINDFVDKLSTKEKISYSLIVLGVILIVIGLLLW